MADAAANPARSAVEADLATPRFRAGVARRHWRIVATDFPLVTIAVASVETDGSASEYAFRFELSGFPGIAPQVIIWDTTASAQLAVAQRPKGSHRVQEAFKDWSPPHPVYRPWERTSGPHGGNWAQDFPDLIWHPRRDLTFILEDLHGLLTSNAVAQSVGPAA
jgi:hypothetical protein